VSFCAANNAVCGQFSQCGLCAKLRAVYVRQAASLPAVSTNARLKSKLLYSQVYGNLAGCRTSEVLS
jgi:hypothetical protein